MGLAFYQKTPEGRTSGRAFDAGAMKRSEIRNIGKQAGLSGKARDQFSRLAAHKGVVTTKNLRELFRDQVKDGLIDPRRAARAGSLLGMKKSALHFDAPAVEPKPLRREESKIIPLEKTPEVPRSPEENLPLD